MSRYFVRIVALGSGKPLEALPGPKTQLKNSKNIKVAHPGLLIESSGLGWFERTYLSVARLVLISRHLPSLMAPSGPMSFKFKLRKDARLMASKTLEK